MFGPLNLSKIEMVPTGWNKTKTINNVFLVLKELILLYKEHFLRKILNVQFFLLKDNFKQASKHNKL